MGDRIIRVTAGDGAVLAFFAETTETVQKAADIHGLTPVAAAALGRILSAAAIMSKMQKGENESLTIRINGKGPIGGITVVGDPDANVRGYVDDPHIGIRLNGAGKLDVGWAVGRNGRLSVIKDLGMKQPYIGSVELQSGEIAEDFAYYFSVSEQIPTIIALGVLVDRDMSVKKAGGYLIQLLPGVEDAIIRYFEDLIVNIKPFTGMLEDGKSIEDIAKELLSPLSYKINEESNVAYKCACSRDRMFKNILAIGKNDLLDILESDEEIEAVCHFCLKKYKFGREIILNRLKKT